MEKKKIIINHPCRIDPYKGKNLEIVRNGNIINTTDGRAAVGDIITVEEKLADKMVNTIFGDKTIASYYEEQKEETEEISEEETTSEETTEDENTVDEENNGGEENTEEGNNESENSEEDNEDDSEEDDIDLSDMTVNELKAYAVENEIEIPSSVKSKADIISYIEEQLKEKTIEEDE